jgi:hydrogenase expression/formation protein HypC
MCLAVPGKVVTTRGSDTKRMGLVSFGGVMKEVSLAFVPEAKVDDYVMVHVGFALSVVDEQEARKTLEYLQQMEEAKA